MSFIQNRWAVVKWWKMAPVRLECISQKSNGKTFFLVLFLFSETVQERLAGCELLSGWERVLSVHSLTDARQTMADTPAEVGNKRVNHAAAITLPIWGSRQSPEKSWRGCHYRKREWEREIGQVGWRKPRERKSPHKHPPTLKKWRSQTLLVKDQRSMSCGENYDNRSFVCINERRH